MFLTTHLEQLRRTLQAIRAFMPHSGVASNSADAPSGHSAAVPVEAATTPPRPHTTPSPTGATLTPQALPRASTTSAPPPLSGGAPNGPGVVLGTDLRTGREVTLPPHAHTGWLIGASGTGKTTLLANLILADIKKGRCIGLIEPYGDLTQMIIAGIPEERLKDVVYLSAEDLEYPFGLNLFECSPYSSLRTKDAVASLVAHAFEKIWGLGVIGTDTPRLMQNIRAFTRTLIDNPGTTIAEAPLLYAFEPVRRRLLSRVQNPQIHLFWEQYAQKNLRDRELYT